jgi:AP-4 complex subunit epsilon-1
MDISTKIAGLAKRLPAATFSGDFEFLVRSIGEAKSKAEEDDLVKRMIEICKSKIKAGFSSKAQNARAMKDFLVYLLYINMLGHDTSWALPTVIQLCGNKNLQVKKVGW